MSAILKSYFLKYILSLLLLLTGPIYVLIILFIFGSFYDTFDDLQIKSAIEGILFYSSPETGLNFVKALFCQIIVWWPNFSHINMHKFDVFQFVIIGLVISFLFDIIIRSRGKNTNKIASAIIVFLLVIPIIIRPQFTVTAGLCGIVLVFLLMNFNNDNLYKRFVFIILYSFFLFIGYSLRMEMFIATIVLLSPFFINISKLKSIISLIAVISILIIGSIEIYENYIGSSEELEKRKNLVHNKLIKIYDYGYYKKFLKSSNKEVLKMSSLSENDLKLISKGFYWNKIDTILPKIESAIQLISLRQSMASRMITIVDALKYLMSRRLIFYSMSLIILTIFVIGFQNSDFIKKYLLSLFLFFIMVCYFGWIQRFSLHRLYVAPFLGLIIITVFQISEKNKLYFIFLPLILLFSLNCLKEIRVNELITYRAKDMQKKIADSKFNFQNSIFFGGNVNLEYLYPPFPKCDLHLKKKLTVRSKIEAVFNMNNGSQEYFFTDSNNLQRLNLFCEEHYNKKLSIKQLDVDLGYYELSMK